MFGKHQREMGESSTVGVLFPGNRTQKKIGLAAWWSVPPLADVVGCVGLPTAEVG